MPEADQVRTREAAAWITEYIAERLELSPASMAPDAPFTQFGVDSTFAVVMSGDISAWTGSDVPPNLLYEYPTINELARYLASLETRGQP